ncbi:PREDICTED: chymotrypsin-1-like [Vollenhovia emeryi]|uniref:chymotrypsin-1-like n=1 Tax=Vollenhovia emeryi TaxID=411798 RepID=UPI0005F4BED4|nr:PREDICTED: chymotrypsin-1-like [Vollenhovia emeryi]
MGASVTITMFSIAGLILTFLIYHSAHGLPDTQIVGGDDAPDGKYPYQVSLKHTFDGKHFCGGAIVSKNYILTAAHCLKSVPHPANVLINVGTNLLYDESTLRVTYAAKNIIKHPDYNDTLRSNDIGLIELTEEMKFNDNIKEINLISSDEKFEGVDFIVTGWGRTLPNVEYSPRLQQIVVKGFNQTRCAETYKHKGIQITDRHLCTHLAYSVGVCQGDSGGALTLNGNLVGIVSFGSCASGDPDVFTRVFPYKSWLHEYINAGNNQQLNILLGLVTMYLCVHLSL